MISIASVLATASFFINSENRAFMAKHVYQPTQHAVVKVVRVARKPFLKKP